LGTGSLISVLKKGGGGGPRWTIPSRRDKQKRRGIFRSKIGGGKEGLTPPKGRVWLITKGESQS